VKEHVPFQALGITIEEVYKKIIANPSQVAGQSNTDSLKVNVRTILKHMHDSGEAERESAKGDNGGSTYAYTRIPSF
jgi:predicted transcriptional regulator